MFENINSTFVQCLSFLAMGAVLGLCYELLRVLRMLFRHPTVMVFIEDTLFFAACGLVSFILALWVGIGYFRIYYIVFEAIGASLYFLTLGRLINYCLRKAVNAAKKISRSLYGKIKPKAAVLFMPIGKKVKGLFSNIAEFFSGLIFNHKKHLQSTDEMLYNSKIDSIENSGEGSVVGGVIKAKIRKKT